MKKRLATLAVVAVASLGLAAPGSFASDIGPTERPSSQMVETMTDVAGTSASRSFACILMRMCR